MKANILPPSDTRSRIPEDEKNLVYVAVTRARLSLSLSAPVVRLLASGQHHLEAVGRAGEQGSTDFRDRRCNLQMAGVIWQQDMLLVYMQY